MTFLLSKRVVNAKAHGTALPLGLRRIRCVVPFCGRTTAAAKLAPDDEWICCNHWPLIPANVKRAYRRCCRRYKAKPTHLLWKCRGMLWRRCKRAAIEGAAGIG